MYNLLCLPNQIVRLLFFSIGMYSLGRVDARVDVTLRHAKGKIAENTVYACALLSAHTDTHGTKGKKGTLPGCPTKRMKD